MKTHDKPKADTADLCELADARYHAWQQDESRPERERRINELKGRDVSSIGRATLAERIYREILEREARERFRFYSQVAREHDNSEMLSEGRLNELRERVMTSVRYGISALKDQVRQFGAATGGYSELVLSAHDRRYGQLEAAILGVVIPLLRVLEAEGKTMKQAIGSKRRTRKLNPTVTRIKGKVRKLREQGLSDREICERMGDYERPPRSGWRLLIITHLARCLPEPHRGCGEMDLRGLFLSYAHLPSVTF